MLGNSWFRFGLLLTAVGLIAQAAMPANGDHPLAYGERLVARYQLPLDAIDRYAAMDAGTGHQEPARGNSMFADRSPWVGAAQPAGVGRNPYTLVFTVRGVAKTAGEVHAQWQAGWLVQESPVSRREVLMGLPPTESLATARGQALSLTAVSPRVSFRGERSVSPMLGLVQMRNLDIQEVEVQVWSGTAPSTWAVLPWSRSVH